MSREAWKGLSSKGDTYILLFPYTFLPSGRCFFMERGYTNAESVDDE